MLFFVFHFCILIVLYIISCVARVGRLNCVCPEGKNNFVPPTKKTVELFGEKSVQKPPATGDQQESILGNFYYFL